MRNSRPTEKTAPSPDALEAFCELIAYTLMDDRRIAYQKKAIKENPYTRGQLEAFRTAEARHGFNAIVDWMKSGETDKLDAADPHAVRATQPPESTVAASALPAYLLNAPQAVLPEKLMLRTISGSASKRLAIINDQTFATMDLARIRLAKTNVTVRCLEIRTNSVLIRFEDSGGNLELFLPEE